MAFNFFEQLFFGGAYIYDCLLLPYPIQNLGQEFPHGVNGGRYDDHISNGYAFCQGHAFVNEATANGFVNIFGVVINTNHPGGKATLF